METNICSSANQSSYQCEFCPKIFFSPLSLKHHCNLHLNPQKFKECGICGKLFSNVHQHMKVHNPTKKFQCYICMKTFNQSSNLIVHLNFHNKVKPYTCEICHKSFTQSNSLTLHMRSHTKQTPYKCDQCNRSYTRQSILNIHKRVHSGERPFACNVCDKAFRKKYTLTMHMKTHTKRQQLTCHVCQIYFQNSHTLQEHMRSHKDDSSSEMPEEGSLGDDNDTSNKSQHRALHNGETMATLHQSLEQNISVSPPQNQDGNLDILGQFQRGDTVPKPVAKTISSSKLETAQQRAKTLHQEKLMTPEFCKSKPDLLNVNDDSDLSLSIGHQEALPDVHHRSDFEKESVEILPDIQKESQDADPSMEIIDESIKKLPIVPQKSLEILPIVHKPEANYPKDKQLQSQTCPIKKTRRPRDNEKEKPFRCDLCEKCYCSKYALSVHLKTHTGEKDYKCEVCNKLFMEKSYLKTHMVIHGDAMPFECEVCNRKFRHRNSLLLHARTSHGDIRGGERMRQCPFCPKSFYSTSHLKGHLMIHTSEKPYECSRCQNSYRHRSTLMSHMKTHDDLTERTKYSCEICQKTYTAKSTLKKHLITHTDDLIFLNCEMCDKVFRHKRSLKHHMESTHKCQAS